MTIEFLLAFFMLLTVASLTYALAARTKIPYTVLLVAIGLLLVPIAETNFFSFLKEFRLTPELLFYIFLPILLFESAYNIRVRHLQDNAITISALAVVALLISTVFIALVLGVLFNLINIHIPLLVLLLFGALISATDPVAVLALFKEYGAPHRLSLIFEGESLFNDGTAVALFFILLEIAYKGYHGASTVAEGLLLFTTMVVGGVAFGLLMGGLFAKLIQVTRHNHNVSIMLMLVMAHLTFILAEVFSHHVKIGDFEVKISAIIATTIASIVLGNYGRYKIAPHAEEFVDKFWCQFAFIANSIIFLLMGLLFSTLPFAVIEFTVPILLAVLVVAVGRALSIYPVIAVLNKLKREEKIPLTWQHLLAWGSLRGALAVTMVLLIPADWRPADWAHAYSPQEFILALTIGCIYATMFIKALTIGPLIRKMKLDQLSDIEAIEYQEAQSYIRVQSLLRLQTLHTKGYIDAQSYKVIAAQLEDLVPETSDSTTPHTDTAFSNQALATQALNIQALGIERYYLHDLFMHGEVTDWVVRRVQANISSQIDKLERGEPLLNHPATVKPDWLERLIDLVRWLLPFAHKHDYKEKFLYYRAKVIITRKVVKELTQLSAEEAKLFPPQVVSDVIRRYVGYNKTAKTRVAQLLQKYGTALEQVNVTLGLKAMAKHRSQLLDDMLCRELITQKVYIALRTADSTPHM